MLRDFSARDHLSWEHVARIRRQWPGALVIKGILHPDDAALAREHGVDGIIVSNHGGRQLDGAVPLPLALPGVLDAAGDMPVMLDRRAPGRRRAQGAGAARCVFVGRPFNYAAAIGGEAGVAHAIGLLRAEVDRNMAMLGINRLDELHPGLLRRDELPGR